MAETQPRIFFCERSFLISLGTSLLFFREEELFFFSSFSLSFVRRRFPLSAGRSRFPPTLDFVCALVRRIFRAERNGIPPISLSFNEIRVGRCREDCFFFFSVRGVG